MHVCYAPVLKVEERICTNYKPNLYTGPLLQKIVDVSNTLKLVIDVEQHNVEVNGVVPYPPETNCTYKISVREIKCGITRPFVGERSIAMKRVRSDTGNSHYAKIDLSNFFVYAEPTKYVAEVRIIFHEPLDDNFHSKIVLADQQ